MSFRPGSGAYKRKKDGGGGSLLWHPAPVRELEGKKQRKGKKKEGRKKGKQTSKQDLKCGR
ncbi:MAG: hypothetical protein BHW58_08025 [Azospirillum sp. 51_20]|nr:MAG: hypothetical protein BHW58_08025 [Azospirillum sp. 51_20]